MPTVVLAAQTSAQYQAIPHGGRHFCSPTRVEIAASVIILIVALSLDLNAALLHYFVTRWSAATKPTLIPLTPLYQSHLSHQSDKTQESFGSGIRHIHDAHAEIGLHLGYLLGSSTKVIRLLRNDPFRDMGQRAKRSMFDSRWFAGLSVAIIRE